MTKAAIKAGFKNPCKTRWPSLASILDTVLVQALGGIGL